MTSHKYNCTRVVTIMSLRLLQLQTEHQERYHSKLAHTFHGKDSTSLLQIYRFSIRSTYNYEAVTVYSSISTNALISQRSSLLVTKFDNHALFSCYKMQPDLHRTLIQLYFSASFRHLQCALLLN